MTSLFKAPTSNFWSTTLNGAIDDSVDSITLNSATGLQAPGYLIIDREDGNGNITSDKREIISFTGISTNTLTGVTRGADNSTATSHSDGALVEATFTVGIHNDSRDWAVVEHNQDGTHSDALVTTLKATGAEIDTGTEDAKIVTPKAIADSKVVIADKTQTLTNKTIIMGDSMPSTNVRCGIKLSSSQSISSETWTTIEFNSKDFDSGNDFNTTTHKFTAPVDGYYLVVCMLRVGDVGGKITRTEMVPYKNDSNTSEYQMINGLAGTNTYNVSLTYSKIYYLSSGDTIFFKGYTLGATSPSFNPQGTFLSIHLLST